MKKISIYWFNFWRNRILLFSVLLLMIVMAAIYGASKINVNEDITHTLPQSADFQKLGNLLDHKGLNSSIYFSLTPPTELTTAELRALGKQLEEDLQKNCGKKIANIRYELREDEFDVYDYIDARIPFYLDSSDYKSLTVLTQPDSLSQKIFSNHQKLYTPEGFVLKEMLIDDPLGITFKGLKKFQHLQAESNFIVKDGLFLLADEKSLFITADLTYETSNNELNHALVQELDQVAQIWDADYEFDYFSSFLIGHANSQQIKKDTFLTSWISISGILLLLLIYYRSLILPLFFVLPAVLGLLIAVGVISIFKLEISAISMGAGAIVLGIIMDYSFHFFTHLKHSASIEETLKDVTNPLLIGSFTTILAFSSLTLTSSPVLQDFGIFAAASLVGALISVLWILPILLPKSLEQKWKNRPERNWNVQIPKLFKRILAVSIIAFSIIAFIFSSKIKFDDDLTHLSFYPEELKESERKLNNINPDEEKRVFILAESSNQLEANELNFEVFRALKKFKEDSLISNYLNTAVFEIPMKEQQEKLAVWNSFWKNNTNDVPAQLDQFENSLGYYETAFDKFSNKISGNYTIPEAGQSLPSFASDLNKLIDSSKGVWQYVSYFTVKTEYKDSVIQALKLQNEKISVIDRGEIAASLIKMVQADFNFILLTSSLLVFLSLLIVYGRIELALITFIPMMLSWVWILGIAAMLNIEFNFINIIISTFIFGLGDDFAIFITDGYVSKFARNKDVISSYRKGIVLSAATTVIGTGALIFAKHPAINSIALLAVIGMVAILFISFTVQPFLLRKLLLERKEKGLPPISLVNLLSSIISFTFFLSGCLIMYPLQLIFRLIPFGQNRLKLFYHKVIRIFAWMNVYFILNVRKKVINRHLLDFNKPAILIANHQSFIDLLMMISLNPKLIIMTNDWVYNSRIFGAQIKYLGYIAGSHGVENNLEAIKPWVEQGYSVLIFPEGTRSETDTIGRFHKGAFFLSQELKLDIVPVILQGFNDTMRKHDFILLNGNLRVTVLPRIAHDDLNYGTTYKERTKNIAHYFKTEYNRLLLENADSAYQQNKVISNYIYKSPFIEWYVKIKWIFERKNFDFYHTLIPTKGKIFDLGCGYGYLSYYLYFRSNARTIFGIDYDEDKIEIAENCYAKNEQIHFQPADLRNVDIVDADAIFLNDVLHYFPEAEQEPFLKKCVNGLNPKGILIIRDGVVDLHSRHKKTELTEKYSTQIIGFNKTKNQICFFSKEFILNFAKDNGLTCEIKEQSSSTSNILFILKHEPNRD
jgi:1-acyl-sn-glycerol-3-phosphate acyltransferase